MWGGAPRSPAACDYITPHPGARWVGEGSGKGGLDLAPGSIELGLAEKGLGWAGLSWPVPHPFHPLLCWASLAELWRDFAVFFLTFAPVLIYMQNQLLHSVFPKYRVWAESYLKPCPVWTSWTRLGSPPWGGADGWRRGSKIGWLVSRERREGGLFAHRIIIFNLKLNN